MFSRLMTAVEYAWPSEQYAVDISMLTITLMTWQALTQRPPHPETVQVHISDCCTGTHYYYISVFVSLHETCNDVAIWQIAQERLCHHPRLPSCLSSPPSAFSFPEHISKTYGWRFLSYCTHTSLKGRMTLLAIFPEAVNKMEHF